MNDRELEKFIRTYFTKSVITDSKQFLMIHRVDMQVQSIRDVLSQYDLETEMMQRSMLEKIV